MASNTSRGGYRPGSGRPPGSGRYKGPTTVIRVPVDRLAEVKRFLSPDRSNRPGAEVSAFFTPDTTSSLHCPLYLSRVAAGFPSPADDYIEGALDLNQHLIKHPAATFFVRVSGESMIGAGIHPGDILVVDRALEPVSGKIVIAVLNGELTVKRLRVENGGHWLAPENDAYAPIRLTEALQVEIWGVVTHVIHDL